ncbi:MAG TPA: hypothetical protein VK149_04325 [Sideroxyarcus sp.]|nr:hypothetical protein [Sideroxyarcus sp.]
MAQSALATAFVNIVPGTKDLEDYLKNKLKDDAGKGGDEAGKKLSEGIGKNLKGLAGTIGAVFSARAVFGFGEQLITAAEEGQRVDATLANITKSMDLFGGSTDTVVSRLKDFATSQMKLTGIDDDVIKGAQAKLMTFGEVGKSAGTMGGAFDQATKLAMDLSKAGFGSVDSAAVMLGKALQDPVAGVTALQRVGVSLTDAQKAQVKAFMDVGDVASAQGIILGEVNRQVGGTAEASATAADKFKAGWEDAKQGIGTALLPVFQNIVSFLQTNVLPAVTAFSDWAQKNPTIMGIIAGAIGFITLAVVGLTVATWAMNTALLANPITWIVIGIVAAIGLLVAAIIWMVNNWDAVVKFISDIFGPVIKWLGDMFTWLWENAIKPVVDFVSAAWNWLYNTIILPVVQGIVATIIILGAIFAWLYENAIKPAFDAVMAAFKFIYENVIKPVIDFIVERIKAWGAIFNWLYNNAIKPAFDAVRSAFDFIWNNVIKPVIDFIVGAIKTVGETVGKVFGGIGDVVKGAFEGLIGIIRPPVNAVIGFLNKAIDGINGIRIDIPEWARGFFGGATQLGFHIPKIPMLAQGGFVDSPTMAMIGEAGPEVVTPLKDFERMMGIGNGQGQTINYYAAPNQSIDSEQALAVAVQRAKVLAAW